MNRSQNINILTALNNFFLTQDTKLIKYLWGEGDFLQVCPKSVGPRCHLWVLILIKADLWTQQRKCIFTFKEERASMTQADRLWEEQLVTSIWYPGSALEMAHSFSSGKGELGSRSVNKKKKKWKLIADLKYNWVVDKEELWMPEVTTIRTFIEVSPQINSHKMAILKQTTVLYPITNARTPLMSQTFLLSWYRPQMLLSYRGEPYGTYSTQNDSRAKAEVRQTLA